MNTALDDPRVAVHESWQQGSEVPLPPALQGVFFNFRWDIRKVWALQTQPHREPIEPWLWHLDLPVWSTVPKRPRFDLKPNDVLENPARYRRHHDRILSADTSFALELFRNGGRWVILDGYHRLAHLYTSGERFINVRLHSEHQGQSILVGSSIGMSCRELTP